MQQKETTFVCKWLFKLDYCAARGKGGVLTISLDAWMLRGLDPFFWQLLYHVVPYFASDFLPRILDAKRYHLIV